MYLKDGNVRKLRRANDVAGEVHELTFSCHRRIRLLSRERTRQWFVEALDQARTKLGFEIWAWVIMPEHVHLLVHNKTCHLVPRILQAIKQPVARRAVSYLRQNNPEWLEKLRVPGSKARDRYHFWAQGGGYDRTMYKDRTIWNAIEYIHQNPVRRGLVDSPLDWPWSSASWYAGSEDVVLKIEGVDPELRRSS